MTFRGARATVAVTIWHIKTEKGNSRRGEVDREAALGWKVAIRSALKLAPELRTERAIRPY